MLTVEFGNPCEKEMVLALGYFDGMHIGHRLISDKVVELAGKYHCTPAISTFADSPNRKDALFSYHDRRLLFAGCGMELCITLYFIKVCRMTGEEFFRKLTGTYKIRALVCGENYTFGSDGCGVDVLRRFCEEKGIGLTVIPLYDYHGVRVSTTAVKTFLTAGDIKSANVFLGSRYFVRGEVVYGDGRGRNIGVPTVNLNLPVGVMEIKRGVYGTHTVLDGKEYRSVTNVGPRPTFSQSKFAIETNLLGYEGGSLLGKEITVYFYKYLRAIRTFKTAEELVAKIQTDKEWKE